MSQYNNPYLPNGQGMPQPPGRYPQAPSFPNGYSQLGRFPSQPGVNGMQGMGMPPGIAASMPMQPQPPVADPNGEDFFSSIIPGPKELAIGAVGGASVALALNQLEKHNVFDSISSGLDGIPGISHVSDAMTRRLKAASQATSGFWAGKDGFAASLRELLHLDTFAATEKEREALEKLGPAATETAFDDAVQRASNVSVNKMQERQLTSVLANFKKRFPAGKEAENVYNVLHASAGKDAVNLLQPETWLKGNKATFEHVLRQTDAQLEKLNAQTTKTAVEKALQKRLHNLKERISGLNEHYLPVYREQTKLSARLQLKGTGPVGRLFANGVHYLKRIFNGDTLRMGGNAAAEGATQTTLQTLKSTLSKFALPGLAGALIFGSSVKKAEKAKDGEKTQTFFHDFMGTAIGNFIGWEFGRKVLNSFQFAGKLLGKHSLNTLPRVFGRTIPLLGSITLGGFVTEMIAMFVIGGVFQNIAEKISDAIFGKPSEESLKGKPSALQPNPVMMNMAMQQAMRQPQYQQPRRQPQFQQQPIRQQRQGQPSYARPYFQGVQQRLMPDPALVPSPDEICESAAATRNSEIEKTVQNSPWDYNNHIDPFDKHGI